MLVKYTWNGDADLGGVINADDFFRIDHGAAQGLTGYRNGDFNYSGGAPTNEDYDLINAANTGQTGPL